MTSEQTHLDRFRLIVRVLSEPCFCALCVLPDGEWRMVRARDYMHWLDLLHEMTSQLCVRPLVLETVHQNEVKLPLLSAEHAATSRQPMYEEQAAAWIAGLAKKSA